MGIYSDQSGFLGQKDVTSPDERQWLADTNLAMSMTLDLYYQGKSIISYDPKRDDPKGENTDKWWVTGFKP